MIATFPSSLLQTRTLALFAASLALLSFTGCGDKTQASASAGGPAAATKKGGASGPAAPVLVGQARRKVVPVTIEAIGAVEPIKTATIRSQVTGNLMKIAIKEGQDVKAGDLLFEIDPRPFNNALAQAQGDREKARVQLENAKTQVVRYKGLSDEAMVSKEQYQQMEDNQHALEAQLVSAEANVANAKLQLEFCSIRAPIAGRSGNLSAHEGDLIRANDVGAMVVINQLSPIYLTFGVPQQHLAALNRSVATGTPLGVIAVPPGTEEAEKGVLTFIDNTVDTTTGTLRLKGTFPNSAKNLWPGQYATVSVTLASPDALVIPASAIQNSQTGQHVFVVTKSDKGTIAELRHVEVERVSDTDAVILTGLKEGETVVTDGQLRVIPGKPVEIKKGAETGTGATAEKKSKDDAANS